MDRINTKKEKEKLIYEIDKLEALSFFRQRFVACLQLAASYLLRKKKMFQSSKQSIKSKEALNFKASGGGDEGSRTPCLLNAIQALSQVSYAPMPEQVNRFFGVCQGPATYRRLFLFFQVKTHLFNRVTDTGTLWCHADEPSFDLKCEGIHSLSSLTQVIVGLRSEEHTSELQSHHDLVCRLLLEKNFFNDTATTEIYTLSLHDALPISERSSLAPGPLYTVNRVPAILVARSKSRMPRSEIGRAHV